MCFRKGGISSCFCRDLYSRAAVSCSAAGVAAALGRRPSASPAQQEPRFAGLNAAASPDLIPFRQQQHNGRGLASRLVPGWSSACRRLGSPGFVDIGGTGPIIDCHFSGASQVHHLDQFLDSTSALFSRRRGGAFSPSRAQGSSLYSTFRWPASSFRAAAVIATVFHHSNMACAKLRAVLRQSCDASNPLGASSCLAPRHGSNYSTILSVWDPVFASRRATRRTPDLEIGVERNMTARFWPSRAPFQQKNLSESP